MADWFRSWHGAPTDSKWLVVAKRAGATPGHVAAVWWYIEDYASQQEERGSLEGFDVETCAAAYGWEESLISAILDALRQKKLINAQNRLTAWDKRQVAREDSSTKRTREYRERTARSVTHGDAGERTVTHRDARERSVTPLEVEVEVEVEQRTDTFANANGADAPQDFPQSFPQKDVTTDGGLMGLVRKNLYVDGKPPNGRREDQDMNTIRTLIRRGVPPPDLVAAIYGTAAMRDDNQLKDFAPPGTSLSMGILAKKPKTGDYEVVPFFMTATNYWHKKQEADGPKGDTPARIQINIVP